jgi:acyl-CoA synthetase (AMP-forming)/AMP-acid ligase II
LTTLSPEQQGEHVNVTLLLDMAAAGFADRTAFGPRRGGISFEDLRRRTAVAAQLILDHAPEHVVFVGRNGPAFPQVLLGSATAGVPFAPLNYRLAEDQLTGLLAQLSRPLVVADADYVSTVADGAERVITTEDFLAITASGEPGDLAAEDADASAVLLFTSGTTAQPKAVVLAHENLVSYILATVEFGQADELEAALVAVPPYHVAAVGATLSNLYAGRRVVYLPDFDAASWLRLVRDEAVTSAMVVPTMLARVLDILGDEEADAPALQVIAYGGARMPRPVLEKALKAFPKAGFCNAYGLTETSSTVALLGPDEHRAAFDTDDESLRRRLGSVGRPVPGVEVQVRTDDGLVAGPDEPGQLWVRGAQVSGQYRGQESALDADGWFHTRDRAHIDEDGYIFIEGRTDDTIIRGGENIAPAEIEDVLVRHPAVKEVAVLGRPDEAWGERIVAVVVPEPGVDASADELRAYVRGRLRGSRTPDEIVWRDELPHTATGKLLRRQLMQELADR